MTPEEKSHAIALIQHAITIRKSDISSYADQIRDFNNRITSAEDDIAMMTEQITAIQLG